MDYKIGDKFHVIIKGFSPTIASIDNITEREGEKFYHISFEEEYLFTLVQTVKENQLTEMIELYERNKDDLEPFMMMKSEEGDETAMETPSKKKDEIIVEVNEAAEINDENEVNFEVKAGTENTE